MGWEERKDIWEPKFKSDWHIIKNIAGGGNLEEIPPGKIKTISDTTWHIDFVQIWDDNNDSDLLAVRCKSNKWWCPGFQVRCDTEYPHIKNAIILGKMRPDKNICCFYKLTKTGEQLAIAGCVEYKLLIEFIDNLKYPKQYMKPFWENTINGQLKRWYYYLPFELFPTAKIYKNEEVLCNM